MMASPGVCITLVNGTTMHLPTGCVFCPTDGELVVHYLYCRAIQVPLPCDFITDVDILRHNPWDIIPAEEKKNGKHFFTRKENKHPGDHRSNRVISNGFWRSASSNVPVYYKARGGADKVLVGMKRSLVFQYGKSSFTEPTKWMMQEFRLADASLLPCHVMTLGDGSELSSCIDAIITKKNDGGPCDTHTHVPLGETMVEPDSSWLLCHIYKKRQRAPHIVIPPAIGNAQEVVLALPATSNAGKGQVGFIDFLGQPSSPNICSIVSPFEEGSDGSEDISDDKDGDGHSKN